MSGKVFPSLKGLLSLKGFLVVKIIVLYQEYPQGNVQGNLLLGFLLFNANNPAVHRWIQVKGFLQVVQHIFFRALYSGRMRKVEERETKKGNEP